MKQTHHKTLAQIHILKSKIGLSDLDYQSMLQNLSCISSSEELTQTQQKELISIFQKQLPKQDFLTISQKNMILYLSQKAPLKEKECSTLPNISKTKVGAVINPLKRYQRSSNV